MRDANAELVGCGRLVVRYSGTEPLLRVMIESDDAKRNEEWMEAIDRSDSRKSSQKSNFRLTRLYAMLL